MEMEQSNWVHLPNDLLHQVLNRLFLFPKPCDYFNFGLVCKSWLNAAAENSQTLLKHCLNYRIPVIAVPSDGDTSLNVDILSSPQPEDSRIILPLTSVDEEASHALIRECYLAESTDGNLLLLVEYLTEEEVALSVMSEKFKVFRMKELAEGEEDAVLWVETKSLNHDVVFVDHIGATCAKVTSECSKYKRNCIYFAGNYSFGSNPVVVSMGMGVYNVADGSLRRRDKPARSSGHYTYGLPTWFFQELPKFGWGKD